MKILADMKEFWIDLISTKQKHVLKITIHSFAWAPNIYSRYVLLHAIFSRFSQCNYENDDSGLVYLAAVMPIIFQLVMFPHEYIHRKWIPSGNDPVNYERITKLLFRKTQYCGVFCGMWIDADSIMEANN